MKLAALVIGVLAAVVMAAYPPNFSSGQDSDQKKPVLKLADPIDTAGLAPATAKLIDSFNEGYLRISAKTDSIIELARQIEAEMKPKKYSVTNYEPPVSVIKIPFEGKTILARYDSTRGVFVEEEIIIK